LDQGYIRGRQMKINPNTHIYSYKSLFFCAVALLVMLCNQTSKAKNLELSLESAILFALNKNPEINIAKEQEKQAKFSIDEAESVFYPQVDFSARSGPEYNSPASFPADEQGSGSNTNQATELNLTVNQLLFDGFSSKEEVERREDLYQSSGHQRTLVQEKIILPTRSTL